ncbi:hypothetical protein ACH3XW_12445 [Acanthocheilonema viteae]
MIWQRKKDQGTNSETEELTTICKSRQTITFQANELLRRYCFVSSDEQKSCDSMKFSNEIVMKKVLF